MARIFAWADAPNAPTGFGRSSRHVLGAFHAAGHDIVQLAVNCEPSMASQIPWRVFLPTDREHDPYALRDVVAAVGATRPDVIWTTFDPEVPYFYTVPAGNGIPANTSAIEILKSLRDSMPIVRHLAWFPVDGGPLSDMELHQLGAGDSIDFPVTMSPHVHELVEWSLKLKGFSPNMDEVRKRLRVIPHGVETDRFQPVTDEQRRELKRQLGFNPDQFVILQLERNQQRKQNYLGMEVLETLFRMDPKLRGRVVLYQHMIPDEESTGCMLGYNLPDLAWRYGLRGGVDVKWPPGFVVEDQLPKVYGVADVFLSVSTGEGFQYPAWEALSAGVPVVVPNDSAREAWFGRAHAPNVYLYETLKRRLVLKGGYQRRMGYPLPEKAAVRIRKLLERGGPNQETREAAHAWVKRTASVEFVQKAWLDLLNEALGEVYAARHEARIAIPSDPASTVIEVPKGGVGDLLMLGPAIEALQRRGERVVIRCIPERVRLAATLAIGDAVEHLNDATAARLLRTDWEPDMPEMADPRLRRQEVFADHLRVPVEELRPVNPRQLPEAVALQARNQFLESFGVDVRNCIAIALESHDAIRSLPIGHVQALGDRILALGFTPLVVGTTRLGIRRVGYVDLSGQTDLVFLAVLMASVKAAVCTDAAPAHLALLHRTPTVVAFTVVEPDARLHYYSGSHRAVTPRRKEIEGETFPAGERATKLGPRWASEVRVDDLEAALRELIGLAEKPRLQLVRPS